MSFPLVARVSREVVDCPEVIGIYASSGIDVFRWIAFDRLQLQVSVILSQESGQRFTPE